MSLDSLTIVDFKSRDQKKTLPQHIAASMSPGRLQEATVVDVPAKASSSLRRWIITARLRRLQVVALRNSSVRSQIQLFLYSKVARRRGMGREHCVPKLLTMSTPTRWGRWRGGRNACKRSILVASRYPSIWPRRRVPRQHCKAVIVPWGLPFVLLFFCNPFSPL